MSKPKRVLIFIGVVYGFVVIVPVLLKLFGVVNWSWMAIATPLWILGGIVVLISAMVSFMFLLDEQPPGEL